MEETHPWTVGGDELFHKLLARFGLFLQIYSHKQASPEKAENKKTKQKKIVTHGGSTFSLLLHRNTEASS